MERPRPPGRIRWVRLFALLIALAALHANSSSRVWARMPIPIPEPCDRDGDPDDNEYGNTSRQPFADVMTGGEGGTTLAASSAPRPPSQEVKPALVHPDAPVKSDSESRARIWIRLLRMFWRF